jgi:hypothetical protein
MFVHRRILDVVLVDTTHLNKVDMGRLELYKMKTVTNYNLLGT